MITEAYTRPAQEYHGRVVQDGMTVARVSYHDHDRMMTELLRYAARYASEGPIRLDVRVGKSRWKRYAP